MLARSIVSKVLNVSKFSMFILVCNFVGVSIAHANQQTTILLQPYSTVSNLEKKKSDVTGRGRARYRVAPSERKTDPNFKFRRSKTWPL